MLGEYDGLGAINLYSYPNNNFSSSTGKVRIYKSNEEGVVSDAATTWKAAASTTQWFTIAVKMEKEGSDFNIRFNPYGGAQNCYVDNFRIAKEIPVSDSATYLDISDFAFDGDTDGDSTMQTATIGERSGAYSVNLTDTADRLYVSNKNKIDLMTTSKAFSFDLYVPENSTCDLTFGAKGYDINQTAISDVMSVKLGVVTDDSTNLAENELYKYELRDSAGNIVDTTQKTINDFAGTWVNIRFVVVGYKINKNGNAWAAYLKTNEADASFALSNVKVFDPELTLTLF